MLISFIHSHPRFIISTTSGDLKNCLLLETWRLKLSIYVLFTFSIIVFFLSFLLTTSVFPLPLFLSSFQYLKRKRNFISSFVFFSFFRHYSDKESKNSANMPSIASNCLWQQADTFWTHFWTKENYTNSNNMPGDKFDNKSSYPNLAMSRSSVVGI